MAPGVKQERSLAVILSWVSFAIIFMAIGTVAELVLISHYEDQWQLLPIILISVVMGVFMISLWKRSVGLMRLFKVLLVACVLSGALGVYFHLRANMEFEAELHPSQPSTTTFFESLSGALPALAPGSMIIFALIGYIYILLINKQHNNESTD